MLVVDLQGDTMYGTICSIRVQSSLIPRPRGFPLLLHGLGARLDTVQPTSQTFNLPPVGMAIMMTEQQRML